VFDATTTNSRRMILRIIISFCVMAAVFCALRVKGYRSWFRLPTHRTDIVHCRLAPTVVPLRLERDGFEVPVGVALLGRTVLLELRVSTSLLGRLFDPFIEVRCRGVTHRQYFERGASGQRFLDLSPHFHRAEAPADLRLRLKGKLIRWQPEALLQVFEGPALTETNVLIVAPHPDDAEIAAFGVYATHRSWVVTVTAGERGGGIPPLEISTEECLRWVALLRVADSLSVPQLGKVGPERCVNLAYPDGALELMHRQPSQSFRLACEPQLPRSELRSMNLLQEFRGDAQCTWNDLVEELRRVLELSKPDIIICPHPLLDTNSDHVFTTRAVEMAVRSSQQLAPLFLLYAVHHAGAPTYPHGPAAALSGVAPSVCQRYVADSIYSHPLEPQLRLAKYFAVENMHGVRNNRMPLKPKILGLLAGLGADPTSFLRRAPRPTEVYYVLAADLLSELLQPRSETETAPLYSHGSTGQPEAR
jgi:LmbE family N-acetylglucosaminyl deacetylase